jgi:hypothetical protein
MDIDGTKDDVHFEFINLEDLLYTILAAADQGDLIEQLDDKSARDALANELVSLIYILGGSLQYDDPGVPGVHITAGIILPKTNLHIRLKQASWQTALALVPIVGAIAVTGGLLLPLLGLVPVAGALTGAITKLDEQDKTLVLAVVALERKLSRPVTATDVHEGLKASHFLTITDTNQALNRLANLGVLKQNKDGFEAVF